MARSSQSVADLDLASFSDDDLEELIATATQLLNQRIQERIEQIRPLAARVGFELSLRKFGETDTAGQTRRRGRAAATDQRAGTVAPKYRNPANPAETWTGRGRKPAWLERQLSAGRQLSEFAITGTEAT